ncbi:MBL fold metallo-hydrolase [Geomonas sp. RF6]|uniref:MBL fold metallo-hydrolase n=1 Tax=Geomonas sp. RF6 TaxID=2897342 RepID=UPI001E3D92C1|nr:MBL fold metallo-hydrolase [Geomonas sp. RF6]UFS70162.1 MBL fold metallo-hydrolase [Geomonas sp. RF6]
MVTSHRVEVLSSPGSDDPNLGSIFFIGTATTLITGGGFTILTDPNFLHAGDHAHLGYGLTSRRRTNPAREIEDLPPLDVCLLSHLHGDHWDHIAQAKLSKDLPIVTTVHAARVLGQRGFRRTIGLGTWDEAVLSQGDRWLRVTSMPGRHGPGVVNSLLPPVMGSMLEWGSGEGEPTFRLYISGDTLVGEHLMEIPHRYPKVNLGLFHLGGTRILGVLVTMDAEEGIKAIRIINADKNIPIHYNDYRVFKSSLEAFVIAVRVAGLEGKVLYLTHGDTYEFRIP